MPILGTIASSYRSAAGGGLSFESIATATGTGSSNTISFTSIPATFKHLQVRAIFRASGSNTGYGVYFRVNNETGGTYYWYWGRGRNGVASIVGSGGLTGQANFGGTPGANSSANIMGMAVIDFIDYANTNKRKSIKWICGCDQNNTFDDTFTIAGGAQWTQTTAINSIQIVIDDGSSWTTASKFYLYGIKG